MVYTVYNTSTLGHYEPHSLLQAAIRGLEIALHRIFEDYTTKISMYICDTVHN